jgi:hypothetical protein
MSISRVISKLSQLLAMLGATLSRLGTMPLYMPLTPSVRTIWLTASKMPEYWYPMPLMVLIWNLRRRTSNGYVIVCATAPETAPAPSLPSAEGTFGRKLCSRYLVDHEVEADVGRHACYGGDNATVQRRKSAFRLVHVDQKWPHAR